MWVVKFDHRSDGGPLLVGPFVTEAAGARYVEREAAKSDDWHAKWSMVPLYVPEAA